MRRSAVAPGAVSGTAIAVVVAIASPPANAKSYAVVHAQVPVFFTRQILLNAWPGTQLVPSGTVTSATNATLLVQALEAGVVGGGWVGSAVRMTRSAVA